MRVTNDDIQIAPLDGLLQESQWVTRHADESRFALLLQLLEYVVSLVEDVVVVVRELDVVREQDFDVIGAKSFQRRLETLASAFGREVEHRAVEATRFRADADLLAPSAFERAAEEFFGGARAVVRGGIDDVH